MIDKQIQQKAKELLESGDVTMVIGWGAGSAPFKTTPVFVEKPEDAQKLVWNPACTNNLAVYLPQVAKKAKVAIVAKPCDSRSIVTLIQENQVPRENLVIIGLPCSGIVDDAALRKADIKLAEVQSLEWEGDSVAVTTTGGKVSVPISDAVREGCKSCDTRVPVVSDVTFGEAPAASPSTVEPMDGSFEERRAYWAEQFDRCIRCYACRQACPGCYCAKCFADRNDVKWTNKKAVAGESWMFQMGRAMHLAGRCVGCGECERACPMEIPLMKLNREVQRHVTELFDFTPGMDIDVSPVLGDFDPGDPDPNGH